MYISTIFVSQYESRINICPIVFKIECINKYILKLKYQLNALLYPYYNKFKNMHLVFLYY